MTSQNILVTRAQLLRDSASDELLDVSCVSAEQRGDGGIIRACSLNQFRQDRSLIHNASPLIRLTTSRW